MLIANRGGLAILAEADDCREALALPQVRECDIVLWRLESASCEITSGIGELRAGAPNAKILLLANGLTEGFYADAISCGVHGVIDRAEDPEVLIKALIKVSKGEVWLDRRVMVDAISDLRHEMDAIRLGRNDGKLMALSTREREVVTLVCQGLKNKQIADRLFISHATVRHHMTSIFNKLEVTDRLELVLYAFRNRLADPPSFR